MRASDDLSIGELPPGSEATTRVNGLTRVCGGRASRADQDDLLAEETPIALEYNGISVATMLASPGDIEDFAMGFSLTEGFVDRPSDIRGIDVSRHAGGIVASIEISSACAVRLKGRRRAMAGRTGCGLCGVETLAEVIRPLAALPPGPPMALAALLAAMRGMRAGQMLHDLTGATHAAAWISPEGQILLMREDVGRHNALDKLLGAMARREADGDGATGNGGSDSDSGSGSGKRTIADHARRYAPGGLVPGAILVSSRASYEMVQKTAVRGIGILAAVSAPTSLARRLAQEANLALIGFMRDSDCTIYSHPQRLST